MGVAVFIVEPSPLLMENLSDEAETTFMDEVMCPTRGKRTVSLNKLQNCLALKVVGNISTKGITPLNILCCIGVILSGI